MAPIATHSSPNAQTSASVKPTNASASPPSVNLNPAVFVHAQAKTTTESHTTIAINPSNLSDATTVCAWFFDSSIPHNELTTALGQMLQRHPLYSGRIVEISSNGLVKIELSNEGVPLSEGKAPTIAINDVVPSVAQGGKNYVVSTTSSSLSSSSHPALTALLPMHSPLTTEALRNQRAPLVVASHVVLADGASVLALRFWSHLFGDRDGVEVLLSEWILPGSMTPVACCVFADEKVEWRQSSASVQKPAPEVKVVGEVAHDTDAREATADYELV
ncbi:hypothetical protein HDU88_001833 [Geranomyces variabilis]|nr:hypothetical protein HDU88_001833 [Geranomyces variabilis]